MDYSISLKKLKDALGEKISATRLPQDASSRVYYRLPESLAVVYMEKRNPEAGGGEEIAPDRAFFELAAHLRSHGINVPEVQKASEDVYLVEDFGNMHLAESAGDAEVYKQAVDLALDFSRVPPLYKRSFTEDVFCREMSEIVDFGANFSETEQQELEEYFSKLAKKLVSKKQVLQHRDFHSWNILVTGDRELAVIDFQDALIAPIGYDVASLLHDRDTDSLLSENYPELLEYALEKFAMTRTDLLETLLQRDIKVAGRFSKLVSLGRPEYARWLPGTLGRIGRVFSVLGPQEVLLEKFPDMKKGFEHGF